MAIDRAAALRTAEKLVRQGKLNLAIAEYLRVVEDQPRDWNTANLLGDLYVRTGQHERATAQFARAADGIRLEGFLAKAGALYKKILRVNPGDEHALLQAGEIAAEQGLLVDARRCLRALADRRRTKGDSLGAAEVTVRLAAIDPADLGARRAGAQAQIELGDLPAAVRALKALASDLELGSRHDEARDALQQAERLAVQDRAPKDQMFTGNDVLRAPQNAPSPDRLRRELSTLGQPELDPATTGRLNLQSPPADDAGDDPERMVQAARPVLKAAPVPPVAHDIDVLLEPAVARPPLVAGAEHRAEPMEVDLSLVLDRIQKPPDPAAPSADLDDVFAQMRSQAGRLATNAGEQEFKKGMALFQAGQLDDSLAALLVASRTLRVRMEAALALGRIFRSRGQLSQAIEWFERGADAPAPKPELGHQLLYELADALESVGEESRALAIYLELASDAGEFRDVEVRVERLTRAQARG